MIALERARALGVAVDGAETPAVLLRALLIDRGMPHPDEVMGAIEDLGLVVVEETATRRADAPWRVGRKLGRTLYEQRFVDGADETDRFLGIMDDSAVAARVVELHNAAPGTRAITPEVEIDEADLRVSHYRHDGQLVNEKDRGVMVTHAPTGLSFAHDEHPSRLQNKAACLADLRLELRSRGWRRGVQS